MIFTSSVSDLQRALTASRISFQYVGLFSLFINLLMLVSPLYMLQLYDRVLLSRSEDTLLLLTLIVVFLFAVMGSLEFIRSRILIRIGSTLDTQLNERLFEAMLKQHLRDPKVNAAQPLSDLTQIRQFLTSNGPTAFFDSPWVPIYIGILFVFHPWLGWFSVMAVLMLLTLAIVNERHTSPLLGEANGAHRASTDQAMSTLRNTEVLQAMGMLNVVRGHWLKRHLNFLRLQSQASDRASIWMNLSKTLRILLQSLILGLGAWLVIQEVLSPGMMIAGSIMLGRALAPIDQMINGWKGFVGARGSYDRLHRLFMEEPETAKPMSLPAPKGAICFTGVSGGAPGSTMPILRNINLEFEAGHAVGIIGPSAAGKTSFARVLLGIWPLLGGSVRFDGAEIDQWDRNELGPYIGYLPQDIELFEGSVSENIARFGEVNAEQVVAAAQLADVHEMILHLPQGYDTPIGVGGIKLSGGQRQRLGLARALYGEPVLIVLDEPNANLDEQGERSLAKTVECLKSRRQNVMLNYSSAGTVSACGFGSSVASRASGPVWPER